MSQTRGWSKECEDLDRCGRVKEICTYANFSLLSELLQGVAANAHQNVWLMHNGTPANFSIVVLNHIHSTYPGRWIDAVDLLLRCSLDIILLDFYFLRHLKPLVHETPVTIVDNHTARIAVSSADFYSSLDLLERVRQYFARRFRPCYHLHGRNFEQFL
ncbi:hypothetical protein TNCV_1383831 [Trichonephila clavipes]|nr:hypothetical protein TNCV_1383831 [Trichonephila clavipes]